jgi:hypothetical protein
VRQIPLTQDKVALVDDEDFSWLSHFKWNCRQSRGNLYAFSWIDGHCISMHRLILNPPREVSVDHKNGDGLDNRRGNIRFATQSQNTANTQRFRKGCSSQFKGVGWIKSRRKWLAYIRKDGQFKYLGRYRDEIEAARGYDKAATEMFGEFAYTNRMAGLL